MKKLIRDWDELKQIPSESETHVLEVGDCNGWLHAKEEKPYNNKLDYLKQIKNQDVYLSTHTFYKEKCEYSTEVLKSCGFDVELVGWDE